MSSPALSLTAAGGIPAAAPAPAVIAAVPTTPNGTEIPMVPANLGSLGTTAGAIAGATIPVVSNQVTEITQLAALNISSTDSSSSPPAAVPAISAEETANSTPATNTAHEADPLALAAPAVPDQVSNPADLVVESPIAGAVAEEAATSPAVAASAVASPVTPETENAQ